MSKNTHPIPEDKAAPIFAVREGAMRNGRIAWRCHLGRRLHQARQAHRGLDDTGMPVTSRKQLGEKLQLSERAIWEIENGVAPLDACDLVLFAEALGVHPGSFFDTEEFVPWSSPVAGRLPYGSVTRALAQLGETERDIVIQLILFLTGRRQDTSPTAEQAPLLPATGQRQSWA